MQGETKTEKALKIYNTNITHKHSESHMNGTCSSILWTFTDILLNCQRQYLAVLLLDAGVTLMGSS